MIGIMNWAIRLLRPITIRVGSGSVALRPSNRVAKTGMTHNMMTKITTTATKMTTAG